MGMDRCTVLGMENVSRSDLLAASRVLIKIQALLPAQGGVVDIFRTEHPVSRPKELGAEKCPQELLQGQTVIAEKPGDRRRSGSQDTGPAGRFLADGLAQAQVDRHSDPNGKQGAEKLPGG